MLITYNDIDKLTTMHTTLQWYAKKHLSYLLIDNNGNILAARSTMRSAELISDAFLSPHRIACANEIYLILNPIELLPEEIH